MGLGGQDDKSPVSHAFQHRISKSPLAPLHALPILRSPPSFAASAITIQQLPGVGPVLGAVFVAEIGDVHRFADPSRLCSWAGLTPQHRESDTVVRRGHITKQGSKFVRWAAVEAIQRQPAGTKISVDRKRIEARRGKNIAKVAAARKLLTLVYYGLRDGHIRALTHQPAAA